MARRVMAGRFPHLHLRGKTYHCFLPDKSGKRHEKSLRTKDANVALERYEHLMSEIRAGQAPDEKSNWTLREAGLYWLAHRLHRVSKKTLNSERSHIRNLERELGENARLRTIADTEQICRYQNCRLQAGASPKTVNHELQTMAGMLQLAKLWKRVEADYKRLREPKSDIPDALTAGESERMLETAAQAPTTAVAPFAAVLAFSSGLRKGEIERIKRGDVHHQHSQPFIRVRRATTKTDAGSRIVALDSIGVWAAEKLLARGELIGSVRPEDYLLPTDRSRHTRTSDPLHGDSGYDPRHHQTSWEWEWIRFREAAGITHRRFHDLRHTYISRAAEVGYPIAVLQAQVGHMSAAMVGWYTHISSRAQYKAACRMEAESPELLKALGIGRDDSVVLEGDDGASVRQAEQVVVASDSRAFSHQKPQPPLRRRCLESLRAFPNTSNPSISGNGVGLEITGKRESSLVNGSE